VCTADFLAGGQMQAASMHMPDYSLISVPQAYITRAVPEVRELAAASVDEIVMRLTMAPPSKRSRP
jgi:hypothetical protein